MEDHNILEDAELLISQRKFDKPDFVTFCVGDERMGDKK